jgi:hypothetical protein
MDELYWNYLETKPYIYVQKQDNSNYKIIIKNNKTKDIYETLFNTSNCQSEIIDFNDCTDLEKILRYGLTKKQLENIKCETIISSIKDTINVNLSLETINESKIFKIKKDNILFNLTKVKQDDYEKLKQLKKNIIKKVNYPIFDTDSNLCRLSCYTHTNYIDLNLYNYLTKEINDIIKIRYEQVNTSYNQYKYILSSVLIKKDFLQFINDDDINNILKKYNINKDENTFITEKNSELIDQILKYFQEQPLLFNIIMSYITYNYNLTYIDMIEMGNINNFKMMVNCNKSTYYIRDIDIYTYDDLCHISTNQLIDKNIFIDKKIKLLQKFKTNPKTYMLLEFIDIK